MLVGVIFLAFVGAIAGQLTAVASDAVPGVDENSAMTATATVVGLTLHKSPDTFGKLIHGREKMNESL